TFIAAEALAVLTIMPRVAHDLGGLSLYGWVFSGFMLASLVRAVAAGRDADRVGPARPCLVGRARLAAGLAVAGPGAAAAGAGAGEDRAADVRGRRRVRVDARAPARLRAGLRTARSYGAERDRRAG